MNALFRLNRIALLIAALLLLSGVAVLLVSRAEPSAAVFWQAHVTAWMVTTAAAGLVPVLSWAAYGVRVAYRRFGWAAGVPLGGLLVVFVVNLTFWGLVEAGFAPLQRQYEEGRVVWIGRRAYVFAHGFWMLSDGYLEHRTRARLADGTPFLGSTLDLLALLRRRGARSVWGTWCYSGDFPYIRKDLITGEETPWPVYASFNSTPGRTLPIWLGPSFVRLGLPQPDPLVVPGVVEALPADTLFLARPTPVTLGLAYRRFLSEVPWLPQADSVSWRPVSSDTVRSLSWDAYHVLTAGSRRRVHAMERQRAILKARIGIARYWIRGRAFPVRVGVLARVYRPAGPSLSPAHADLRTALHP